MTLETGACELAHELRQPLSAILTNAQAAQRLLGPQAGEVREILDDIVASDKRAADILGRLEAALRNAVTSDPVEEEPGGSATSTRTQQGEQE